MRAYLALPGVIALLITTYSTLPRLISLLLGRGLADKSLALLILYSGSLLFLTLIKSICCGAKHMRAARNV